MQVPKKVVDRFYYIVPIPVDKDGNGPCELRNIHHMEYEVWDQVYTSHFTSQYLVQSVIECEKLNERYYENLN